METKTENDNVEECLFDLEIEKELVRKAYKPQTIWGKRCEFQYIKIGFLFKGHPRQTKQRTT